MHLECRLLKSSAANNCVTSLTTNLTVEANSVGPDQTAQIGAVCYGSILFVIDALNLFNRRHAQTTIVVIGALRATYLNRNESYIMIYNYDLVRLEV